VTATGAAGQETAPEVEFHPPESAGATDLPFSEVVRVGTTLYLSGQLGVDPETGQLVSGGVGAETRRIMQNIQETLRRHGSSMDRVVKCSVFLADMSEWGAMNEVYVEFFPENRPARSALGVNGLALDARVEIECVAVVGDRT
jgi:reactive intermediate/imine deaminase